MFVVNVQHKDAYWMMCYGPFDNFSSAEVFAHGKMKNDRLRVLVMKVADPDA